MPKTLILSKVAFFDVDKLVSTIVLAKLVSKAKSTQVEILISGKYPTATLAKLVSTSDLKFIESLNSGYFSIRLPRGNAKVKEVKWEETPQEIKLLVYTESGNIATFSPEADKGLPEYSEIYTLGIKSRPDVDEILGESKLIWDKTNTINLDFRQENTSYATTNIVETEAKTYAETVVAAAKKFAWDINSELATDLLTAVYWKTNSLRNKYISPQIWDTVGSLIKQGGKIDTAQQKVFGSLSLIEIKARQEVLQNLVVNTDKVALSRLSKDTAQQLIKQTPVSPQKNPLVEMADTWASFVLIPIDSTATMVLCSYREDKVNVKKLFGDYRYVGDPLQAELTFDLDVEATQLRINQILDSKVFGRNGKQSSPEIESNDKPVLNQAKQVTSEPEQHNPDTSPEQIPLIPANEVITPQPASTGTDLAPQQQSDTFPGLGNFGPVTEISDPLPSVKSK